MSEENKVKSDTDKCNVPPLFQCMSYSDLQKQNTHIVDVVKKLHIKQLFNMGLTHPQNDD